MAEKKPEDRNQKDLGGKASPLDLKDWILFLNTEFYQYIEFSFLILAIVIALNAISLKGTSPILQMVTPIILFF